MGKSVIYIVKLCTLTWILSNSVILANELEDAEISDYKLDKFKDEAGLEFYDFRDTEKNAFNSDVESNRQYKQMLRVPNNSGSLVAKTTKINSNIFMNRNYNISLWKGRKQTTNFSKPNHNLLENIPTFEKRKSNISQFSDNLSDFERDFKSKSLLNDSEIRNFEHRRNYWNTDARTSKNRISDIIKRGTFSHSNHKSFTVGGKSLNGKMVREAPLAPLPRTARNWKDLAALSKNISTILESLLKNYDNKIRPGFREGKVTTIKMNMLIRSMGPIAEQDMKYSMDCYLRQEWHDERLTFEGPSNELTLNIKMLEALWKPDTFFLNGLGSYIHTITRPNKLFRITRDGMILYSMRLTIKAKCPMELRNFPMDKQSCPLIISSYAYTEKDVKYQWDSNLVSTDPAMGLSSFDLLDTKCTNYSAGWKGHGRYTVNNGEERDYNLHIVTGNYSILQVNFNLQRHTGYFLIQIYVPCFLIVVLSWVSFWLNREATSDRVGLGITTVLTLSTISLDSRTDLPKVHYATALDWFILMSFGYCMATLLQCAGVHYFTKVGFGDSQVDNNWYDVEDDEGDVSTETILPKPKGISCSIEECNTNVVEINDGLPLDSGSEAPYYRRFLPPNEVQCCSQDISIPSCSQNYFHEDITKQNQTRSIGFNFSNSRQSSCQDEDYQRHRLTRGYSVEENPFQCNAGGQCSDFTVGMEEAAARMCLNWAAAESAAGLKNNSTSSCCVRSVETQTARKEGFWYQFGQCIISSEGYRRKREKEALQRKSVNSVSKIDKVARVLFPLSYGLLNLWYWYSYYDTELNVKFYLPPGMNHKH